jgi:hypothetical protein
MDLILKKAKGLKQLQVIRCNFIERGSNEDYVVDIPYDEFKKHADERQYYRKSDGELGIAFFEAYVDNGLTTHDVEHFLHYNKQYLLQAVPEYKFE